MSRSGHTGSCGPCGPPGPGWPPAWLSEGASNPLGPTLGGGAAEAGGDRTADVGEPSADPFPPATTLVPDPVAQSALDAALRAIEAEVVRRTDDERLRQAARNLLDDCRTAFAAGEPESALASTRHLGRSIPAYLSARGIP